MTLHESQSLATGEHKFEVRMSEVDMLHLRRNVVDAVIGRVAQEIAQRFLEEHGAEVLAKITPEAVATLAMAEAGAAVNETLKKKLPDKVLVIEHEHRRRWW